MWRPHLGNFSDNSTSFVQHNALISESEVRCRCGYKLWICTSTMKRNPGRRFMSCPVRGDGKRKYFVWLDPEIPSTTLEIFQ
ncbi:hypothetical protein ACS0TY_022442 [Phlomoides rotata]